MSQSLAQSQSGVVQSVAQPSSQPVTPQSTAQPATQQTPQEVIGAFERTYVSKMQTLADMKDQLTKAQDQVLQAQEAVFKAYQALTNCKENYLVTLINSKQAQINSLTAPHHVVNDASSNSQVTALPPRGDNL